MHAVVNHLPIKPDADWATLAAKVDAFNATVAHTDFHGFSLIRAGDNEAIMLALFATRAALDEMSRDLAAPWFGEHVKPYLAGPVSRSTGEIVAGALRAQS
ncbi:MAG: hypothetical protein WCA36_01355 [Pseudolabrys sp.]|jgi:hypothetical protein